MSSETHVLASTARGIPASLDALLVIMRIFRTYARAYGDDLDAVLAPLTTVTGEPVSTRFTMPNSLELATVGRVLVVAGDERVVEPSPVSSGSPVPVPGASFVSGG